MVFFERALTLKNTTILSRLSQRGIALAAAAFFASSTAWAEDESPAVVPYRPSVATSADLPAPGWPELEAGLAWAKGGDAARSRSTPLLFKLAFEECWGLLIGTDAYAWQRAEDGSTAHSGGDTTLTLKYKLPVDEHLMLGTELGVALPTARPPFGTGKADWSVNTIASFDYPSVHVDATALVTHLGAVDAGQGPWQGVWAISASHSLDERIGVTGEVSGAVQRGTPAQTQGLMALTYNVSRALVLDVGVAKRLSRGGPDWQLLAGMTVQLGHWF